jgi:flagellar hook-associated protein 1 FlgK
MANLFGTLSVAVRSMLAAQGSMEVTANNVANINTPGYARQRPLLLEAQPIQLGDLVFGTGVDLAQAQTLRDQILELRMHEETQQQSLFDARVAALRQIETMFGQSAGDLGTRLTEFFNSLDQLATNAADLSLRQNVLTAATNLAQGFRTTAHQLQGQQANLDLSVTQAVEQVNVLIGQISRLNGQIDSLENLNEDASILINQRTLLIRNLSGLIDVKVIETRPGVSLTTSDGTALVADQQMFPLETRLDSSGLQHIFSQGSDITSTLHAGKISGLLSVRDQTIPRMLNDLDLLASSLSNALNAVHRAGYDLTGAPGGDLFAPPPPGLTGAAAAMEVALSGPSQIAASADGASGSNGNLALLSGVKTQPVARGQNPLEFYAGMVFGVGSDVANDAAEAEASGLILRQLEDQRSAISGVSLDEEAANLIRFQRAYEASARVVATVSEMTATAIQLGRY